MSARYGMGAAGEGAAMRERETRRRGRKCGNYAGRGAFAASGVSSGAGSFASLSSSLAGSDGLASFPGASFMISSTTFFPASVSVAYPVLMSLSKYFGTNLA